MCFMSVNNASKMEGYNDTKLWMSGQRLFRLKSSFLMLNDVHKRSCISKCITYFLSLSLSLSVSLSLCVISVLIFIMKNGEFEIWFFMCNWNFLVTCYYSLSFEFVNLRKNVILIWGSSKIKTQICSVIKKTFVSFPLFISNDIIITKW